MSRNFLSALFVLATNYAPLFGQTNLVWNPGFESTNTCALEGFWGLDTTWFDDPFLYRAAPFWISANRESPDFCNACQTDGIFYGVPLNAQGFQYAKEGKGYMGIITYEINLPFAPNGDFREYIQTRLMSSLEPGAIYRGRFFVSPSYEVETKHNIVAIDGIAMALTHKPPVNKSTPILINPTSKAAIILEPQIVNRGLFPRDTGAWQEICGIFKARGGEEWLTMGNFYTRQNSDTLIFRPAPDPASESAGIFRAYYFIDDISLIKVSEPIFQVRDTAVCAFPFSLSTRAGFSEYEWSTGDTTQTIAVHAPGVYWVRIHLPGECTSVTDTITVTQKEQKTLTIGDASICAGLLPLVVVAQQGFSNYEWSNGNTTPQTNIWASGEYSVAATYECGTLRDTFIIDVLEEVPDFELGDSLNICVNDQDIPARLEPSSTLPNYEWSTGARSQWITVNVPGQYWLRSSNICGEKSDNIEVIGCPSRIYIPNAFSPNSDGENDVFTVFGRNAGTITLQIFDRWGSLVFRETGNETLEGWDGTFRGNDSAVGVYVYYVNFTDNQTGQLERITGSVTLLR
ncbi:MAG: gliding motility-associated C-terminal domain-containing protein [Saprospiraceae bacterium]